MKEKFLSDAAEQYPKAGKYLAAWTKTVRAARWRNLAELRRCYGSADVVHVSSGKPVIVHGDGLSLWTFTHNSDFAKAFVGLMDNPHAIGEAVHITSDETITWNAAFASIGRALGIEPNLVHIPSEFLAAFDPEQLGNLIGDKANSVIFDNTKIKTLVPGFCASVRFDQGVKRAVDYVTTHPDCQIPDPDFDAWSDRVIAAYCSGMLK